MYAFHRILWLLGVERIPLQVRIYEVGASGQTQGKAMFSHQGPVLSVCWNKVRRHEFFRWIYRLMEIYRRGLVSSQREPTAPAECMMFRPVKPLKSQNTTALSVSANTSIPPAVE